MTMTNNMDNNRMNTTSRRDFLRLTAAVAATPLAAWTPAAQARNTPLTPPKTRIPRWRGFNLLDMFTMHSNGDFAEDDFKYIRDWGFDFVRLPMCHRLWMLDGDDHKINEPMLEKIDRAVDLGEKYKIHVSLNFHRGPGYSVNREFTEPYNLWKDPNALDAFIFHWTMLAKRYRSIPNDRLSINLINEPADTNNADRMTRDDHERVVRKTVAAIREISPQRTIIIDGLSWARIPCPELADLGLVQSTRAYEPMTISHYKASWVNSANFPTPVWPGNGWDKDKLRQHYQPWIDLKKTGAPVHCGEGGTYNKTPHDVTLKWLRDVLEILTENDIGYAIWNFRGSFGIMDSDRSDVDYEDYDGHKLDRKMLNLLQEF